jgi:hypothetical protein
LTTIGKDDGVKTIHADAWVVLTNYLNHKGKRKECLAGKSPKKNGKNGMRLLNE